MKFFASLIVAVVVASFSSVSFAQDAPFGGDADVAFAKKLWGALIDARMVGPNSIRTTTYEGGTGLHAVRLITLEGDVNIDGNSELAIVKKNFRGAEGADAPSDEDILNNPNGFPGPVTVMVKRPGFDPDNQDWFWAVFLPNGNVVKNPLGLNMAGAIVGGGAMADAPFNCIACHAAAPGDDYVFLHDNVPAN